MFQPPGALRPAAVTATGLGLTTSTSTSSSTSRPSSAPGAGAGADAATARPHAAQCVTDEDLAEVMMLAGLPATDDSVARAVRALRPLLPGVDTGLFSFQEVRVRACVCPLCP